MKVCIVSDSHDRRDLLKAAVTEAKQLGASAVLHAGDVVAPTALRPLQELGLPVHVIHGNNEGDIYAMMMLAQEPNSVIHYHGMEAGIELGGRRIFIVHYPHYARAMALTGDWDLVCTGHDHHPDISRIESPVTGKECVIANPGSIAGLGPAPSYIFGDLETMQFEHRPVIIDRKPAPSTPR